MTPLCTECNEPEDDPRHALKNWTSKGGEGHPFVAPELPPLCTYPGCGRPRGNHRGSIGHAFEFNPNPSKPPVVHAQPETPAPAIETKPAVTVTRHHAERNAKGELEIKSSVTQPIAASKPASKPETRPSQPAVDTRTSAVIHSGADRVERVLELADEIRTRRDELEELMREMAEMVR